MIKRRERRGSKRMAYIYGPKCVVSKDVLKKQLKEEAALLTHPEETRHRATTAVRCHSSGLATRTSDADY